MSAPHVERAWVASIRSLLLPLLVASLAAIGWPAIAHAQNRANGNEGGGCDIGRGFACEYRARTYRGDDGVQWTPLAYVVIWRVPDSLASSPRSRRPDSTLVRAYRDFVRSVEEQDRTFSGGTAGQYFTALAHPGLHRLSDWDPSRGFRPESLFVADRALEIPVGDTVLVILVDGVYTAGGPVPRVHDVLRRPSTRRESGVKQWRNGDTTFIVRPRGDRLPVTEDLLALPEVRAFIRRPSPP